jgi:putative membrane protein
MIRGYADHAANERTFLAWVRTGIAVIAFGFVIERFNLFVLAMVGTSPNETTHRLLDKLSGPLGRYDGLAVMLGGLAIIIVATARFIRTERLLDDPDMHSAGSARTELILSATLMLLVVGLSGYLVLG